MGSIFWLIVISSISSLLSKGAGEWDSTTVLQIATFADFLYRQHFKDHAILGVTDHPQRVALGNVAILVFPSDIAA